MGTSDEREARDERARTIGRRIRDRRLAVGLNQSQVATYAKVSSTSVSRIERGLVPRMSAGQMGKIASALGVSVTELMEGTEEDIDLEDPELDLAFYSAKSELSPDEKRALMEQIRLALRLSRERRGENT